MICDFFERFVFTVPTTISSKKERRSESECGGAVLVCWSVNSTSPAPTVLGLVVDTPETLGVNTRSSSTPSPRHRAPTCALKTLSHTRMSGVVVALQFEVTVNRLFVHTDTAVWVAVSVAVSVVVSVWLSLCGCLCDCRCGCACVSPCATLPASALW